MFLEKRKRQMFRDGGSRSLWLWYIVKISETMITNMNGTLNEKNVDLSRNTSIRSYILFCLKIYYHRNHLLILTSSCVRCCVYDSFLLLNGISSSTHLRKKIHFQFVKKEKVDSHLELESVLC